MSWREHVLGADPVLDEIIMRRFGRDHDKPCADPTVLTCTFVECQVANRCQKVRDGKGKTG
jgi:hypothetical protein